MIGFLPVWPLATVLLLAACCWVLFAVNRRDFRWSPPHPAPDETLGFVTRTTLLIPTPSGDRIEAWLHRPAGPPAPVIVMAPGLAGTKEGPLERFAWAFADAGFAVLSFDFRSFGGSEGLPRHDVSPNAHTADFEAVIAHVRAGRASGADAARLVLWGTSFSGASAICAAATSPVEAVILHVPYLGVAGKGPGFVQMSGYIGLVLAEMFGDAIARLVGVRLNPVYIAAYGKPGEAAFGPSRDCPSRHGGVSSHPFWKSLPQTYRGGWRNLMLVRALKHLDAIDPAKALQEAACPVLVIAAAQDDMIRIEDTHALCRKSERAVFTQIDAGHFDPYVDPHFAPNLAAQVNFLCDALSVRQSSTAWSISSSDQPK